MNTDILVPISFFILALLALRTVLSHRENRRRELHETLRVAMQSGEAVPDDLLRRLATAADPRRSDLRRAIVLGVIASIVLLLGALLPFSDAVLRRSFLCIAVIPGAMALTYLGLWRFWYRQA